MGLLEEDAEWEIALEEVTASGSSHQIRAIFAVLLQFCQPTDPSRLYEKFKDEMSEDFVYAKIKDGEFT